MHFSGMLFVPSPTCLLFMTRITIIAGRFAPEYMLAATKNTYIASMIRIRFFPLRFAARENVYADLICFAFLSIRFPSILDV